MSNIFSHFDSSSADLEDALNALLLEYFPVRAMISSYHVNVYHTPRLSDHAIATIARLGTSDWDRKHLVYYHEVSFTSIHDLLFAIVRQILAQQKSAEKIIDTTTLFEYCIDEGNSSPQLPKNILGDK